MTAINTIQTHDAIYFFSDGAFVDAATGRLVMSGQKAFGFPAARFAVSVSGPQAMCEQLCALGSTAENIGQFVTDVEVLLPKIIEIMLDNWPPLSFEIHVGGFSPEGERQLWKIEGNTKDRQFTAHRLDSDAWRYSPAMSSVSVRAALGEDGLRKFERGLPKVWT